MSALLDTSRRHRTSYLPAEVQTVRRISPEEVRALEGWSGAPVPEAEIHSVFTPQPIGQESGMERSLALLVRLLPFSAVWLLLTIGIVWKFQTGLDMGFLIFAGLSAVTWYKLSGQEYAHSSSGVERHRIDTAYALKMQEMAHQQELRRMALESTLKLMEGRNHERY